VALVMGGNTNSSRHFERCQKNFRHVGPVEKTNKRNKLRVAEECELARPDLLQDSEALVV
jgi:hypothetical protein